MKILILDDEEKFAKKLKSDLEKKVAGVEIQVVLKGEEAVEVAKTFKPDVGIFDVEMPGIAGPHVWWQFRREEKLMQVPIMFLSQNVKNDQTEMFAGVIEGWPFQAKPILPKGAKIDAVITLVNRLHAKRSLLDDKTLCKNCKKKGLFVNEVLLDDSDPAELKLYHMDCEKAERMATAA